MDTRCRWAAIAVGLAGLLGACADRSGFYATPGIPASDCAGMPNAAANPACPDYVPPAKPGP